MRRAPRNPDPVKRWLTFLRNHREALLLYSNCEKHGPTNSTQILAIRSRRKVWRRRGFGSEEHGKPANSHGLSQSVQNGVAERL